MADPTPKTKGNLPRMREDDRPGHEILPRRPIEWYERADPTTPGDLLPRFTTDPQHGQRPEIVERFKKGGGERRGFVYEHGGTAKEAPMADKDDDVGSAKRRAMEKSIDYGEKSFGPLPKNSRGGGSNITSEPQVRGEPTVSPLIQIYPTPRYGQGGSVKHGSSTCVSCTYTDGSKYK